MADQSPPSPGLLDFFVLEAGDYLEKLDRTLGEAGPAGPDRETFLGVARALRGSATMARLPDYAETATAFERVAKAVRDGHVEWEPRVHGALVGAVDEMKVLLHRVRQWGEPERQRARERTAELSRIAPESSTADAIQRGVVSGTEYLAGELSNLGAGLELLLTSPAATTGMAQVLQRVRTLRGVAGIRDLPRLPEVLDAAERALEGAERRAHSIADTGRTLLESSAALLRDLAVAMSEGRPPGVRDAVGARFDEAYDSWEATESGSESIRPVDELFFDDDGPRIVSAAQNPPTTIDNRFALEVVGRGENLRQVVSDARAAIAGGDSQRAVRSVRSALRALRDSARSFSQGEFAAAVDRAAGALSDLDATALDRLERIASDLVTRGPEPSAFTLDRPAAERTPPVPQERGAEPPAEIGFDGEELPEVEEPSLQSMLDRSIGALDQMGESPLADAAPPPETPIVPVESLLYRGRAALDRAAEIRHELAGAASPASEQLEELFDLIDLARAS
jgi:chemotaxis protein histidine kinase CheA